MRSFMRQSYKIGRGMQQNRNKNVFYGKNIWKLQVFIVTLHPVNKIIFFNLYEIL